MRRLACVDVAALPLQLLLRRHPAWAEQPAAVVAEDKPNGVITWVDPRARELGVLPGMRYAAALSLARELRAGVVDDEEVAAAVAELLALLSRFSPRVEACAEEPGVAWLDASGLEGLFPSLGAWGEELLAALGAVGLEASLAVGFTRFGSYAVARSCRGLRVLASPREERRAASEVPLDRLPLDPACRDVLLRLGVRTTGRFLALPAAGIGRRFGEEAKRLHRLGSGDLVRPLRPVRPEPPVRDHVLLDEPLASAGALTRLVQARLPALLAELTARGLALATLTLRMVFEGLASRRPPERVETLRPAAPTRDEALVLDLVRLRLEALALPAAVEELELAVRGMPERAGQVLLPILAPPRDLAAGNAALARVRAELGEGAVVRARLADRHLPEGRFAWAPLSELVVARPRLVAPRPLVRRIHPPRPAGRFSSSREDGWSPAGLRSGPVLLMLGPYELSGGWWSREVHRRYHFAETNSGELLWLYRDVLRRRWFVQGRVE